MSEPMITLSVTLTPDGTPPTEFRIFSAGENRSRTQGSVMFDADAADAVMKHAVDFAADYPVDYGHAMFDGTGTDPAHSHKAAGWFKPDVRNGELWATSVTWTPTAARMLADREYRYMSPAFMTKSVEGQKMKRVEQLLNVALTNVPETKGLQPLVASVPGASPPRTEERKMATIELGTVAATIGAPATATEGDVMSTLSLQRDASTELRSVTGKDNLREALGVINGWKAQAAEAPELRAKLSRLETDVRSTAIKAKVDAKVSARVITPAQGEQAVKFGLSMGEEALDAFLGTFTSPVVAGVGEGPTPEVVTYDIKVPSPDVLKRLKMTAEQYATTQKKMKEEGVF